MAPSRQKEEVGGAGLRVNAERADLTDPAVGSSSSAGCSSERRQVTWLAPWGQLAPLPAGEIKPSPRRSFAAA